VIAQLTKSSWVRAALTLGILTYLATDIDLAASGRALVRLAPAPALAVLVLVALDRATMISRWIILVRSTGGEISAKSATWIYLVSSFVGTLTAPMADAARAYSLSRRTTQVGAAVASVAVDRLLGLVSIVLMGSIGLIIERHDLPAAARRVLFTMALVAITGCAAILSADRWVGTLLPRRGATSPIRERFIGLAEALGRYRGHRSALLAVLLLSIAVQVLRILQAYLLGRGIGIDVPFSYYLLFMPLGLVALMLPISIGGFGLPQGLIVWLLQPRGVPQADALALSTLIVLTGIVSNLPGALFYLRRKRAPTTAEAS
jgi:uncharacterized protein (TIRG00374 family)